MNLLEKIKDLKLKKFYKKYSIDDTGDQSRFVPYIYNNVTDNKIEITDGKSGISFIKSKDDEKYLANKNSFIDYQGTEITDSEKRFPPLKQVINTEIKGQSISIDWKVQLKNLNKIISEKKKRIREAKKNKTWDRYSNIQIRTNIVIDNSNLTFVTAEDDNFQVIDKTITCIDAELMKKVFQTVILLERDSISEWEYSNIHKDSVIQLRRGDNFILLMPIRVD